MKTVSFLIVATGKYEVYVKPLIDSIKRNFKHKGFVNFFVFTDSKALLEPADEMLRDWSIKAFYVPFSEWPWSTLMRFHFFRTERAHISQSDYYYYIDADTLMTGEVNFNEIVGKSVAVQHCGFMQKRGTYETNPKSVTYVNHDEGTHYFGGGFWGFDFMNFWHMINECTYMVDKDQSNGITPVHNDESVINRYFIDHPPQRILTPSFHYPQSNIEKYKATWPEDYPCKILLLDKNHKEMRSI